MYESAFRPLGTGESAHLNRQLLKPLSVDYFGSGGFGELVWKTETEYIWSQLRLSGPVLNENVQVPNGGQQCPVY